MADPRLQPLGYGPSVVPSGNYGYGTRAEDDTVFPLDPRSDSLQQYCLGCSWESTAWAAAIPAVAARSQDPSLEGSDTSGSVNDSCQSMKDVSVELDSQSQPLGIIDLSAGPALQGGTSGQDCSLMAPAGMWQELYSQNLPLGPLEDVTLTPTIYELAASPQFPLGSTSCITCSPSSTPPDPGQPFVDADPWQSLFPLMSANSTPDRVSFTSMMPGSQMFVNHYAVDECQRHGRQSPTSTLSLPTFLANSPKLKEVATYDKLYSFTKLYFIMMRWIRFAKTRTVAGHVDRGTLALSKPLRTRTKPQRDGYSCDFSGCSHHCNRKCEMTKHRKRAHTVGTSHCTECAKPFHYPKDVLRHQLSMHPGIETGIVLAAPKATRSRHPGKAVSQKIRMVRKRQRALTSSSLPCDAVMSESPFPLIDPEIWTDGFPTSLDNAGELTLTDGQLAASLSWNNGGDSMSFSTCAWDERPEGAAFSTTPKHSLDVFRVIYPAGAFPADQSRILEL